MKNEQTLTEALLKIDKQYLAAEKVGRNLGVNHEYLKGLASGFESAREYVKEYWEAAREEGRREELRYFAKRIEDLQDVNFTDNNQSLGYAMAIKDVLQKIYTTIAKLQNDSY